MCSSDLPPATTSSSTSSTPFKTPLSEFPAPPRGPGSFYNLPSASASGGISSSGVRTISAAAFKRQLRSPSSPTLWDPISIRLAGPKPRPSLLGQDVIPAESRHFAAILPLVKNELPPPQALSHHLFLETYM